MSDDDQMSRIERGALCVLVLHEAWLFSMETIDQQFRDHKITGYKKRRLKSKYTSFYESARTRYLKEDMNIVELEGDAKTMLMMLNDLGVDGFQLLWKFWNGLNDDNL